MSKKTKKKTVNKAKNKKRVSARGKAISKPITKKAARSITLNQWLEEFKNRAESADAAGAEKGACLVPNPQTGENDCIFTDSNSCKAVQGTFIGGPCGPMTEL
jgi:hypothetical protein